MPKISKTVAIATSLIALVLIIFTVIYIHATLTPMSTPPIHLIVDTTFTVDANSYKA